MKEFKLQLNNPPGGVYFPGMTVTGTVIAVNDEPKDYRAIQVKLKGKARVSWFESHDETSRHYSATEVYIDTFVCVWDKDTSAGGGVFPAGSYQFPFSLQLVGNNLPASYDGIVGKIRYKVEAKALKDGLLKRDMVCQSNNITVANIVQINSPDLLQPKSMEVRKIVGGFLCSASGPVTITAAVPRTGYCIQRDSIPLEVSVENGSSSDINRIVVSLRQLVHYTAEGHDHNSHNVLTVITSYPIRAHNSTVWRPSPIAVPDTPATLVNSGILQVNYTLRVIGSMTWSLSPLTIDIPLVLGNAPLPEDGITVAAPQPAAPYPLFAPPYNPPAEAGIPLQPYPTLPPGFADPVQKM